MDYSFLLGLLPHTYAGYASAVISISSILAAFIPQKTAVGRVVHFIGMNFGQAANASAAPAVPNAAPPAPEAAQ